MGTKYNKKYKKGKFLKGSTKSKKADLSKTAWKNITENYQLWKSDTRKYDYPGIDTGPNYGHGIPKNTFKYTHKSKKKLGKKIGRQNKTHRRYHYD